LKRASEVGERTGEAVHALKEPVRLRVRRGGVEIVRPRTGRCSQRRSRALEVLDHWGEVKDWWDADRHIGRVFLGFSRVVSSRTWPGSGPGDGCW